MALAARKNKQMKNQEENHTHTHTQLFIDIHNTMASQDDLCYYQSSIQMKKKDMGVASLVKVITPLFPE